MGVPAQQADGETPARGYMKMRCTAELAGDVAKDFAEVEAASMATQATSRAM